MINFVNTGADEAILKSMSTDGCSEDLIKAMNKQGLVQKDVTVQGKNGKTFTRKQWVKAGDVKDSGKSQKPIPEAVKECGVFGGETVQELEKIRHSLYKDMTYYYKKYDKAVNSNASDANTWGIMAEARQRRLGALDRYIKEIKSAQNSQTSSTQPDSQQPSQTAQVAQNTAGNGTKLSKEDAKKKTQSYTSKIGKTESERKAFMDKVKTQGINWTESDNAGINWMRCCMAMNKHFAEGGDFDNSKGSKGSSSKTKQNVVKSFNVTSKSDITKDMVTDGSVFNFDGSDSNGSSNGLCNMVYKISQHLEVGDEIVISNDTMGYITPNPTKADSKGVHRETHLVITAKYQNGNRGYTPVYGGLNHDKYKENGKKAIKSQEDRSWRDITDGALYLIGADKYTLKVNKGYYL